MISVEKGMAARISRIVNFFTLRQMSRQEGKEILVSLSHRFYVSLGVFAID
jgi:hypothetical protein